MAGAILTACAGGAKAPKGPVVTVQVNDQMRFVPSRLVVPLGRVTIRIRNVGTIPHDLDIPALHDESATVAGGQTAYMTIDTTAAKSYYFDCDFHVEEGMVGTLVVKSPG
jgi:plastocyanin